MTLTNIPARIIKAATSIQASKPHEHTIPYVYPTWKRWFPDDADLSAIYSRHGNSISRGNLFTLGREAQYDGTLTRRFAMAVMIWGYGTGGRGPFRTAAMLSHPDAAKRLADGAAIVRGGDLVDACLYFCSRQRGKLDQFSWSFFTKYFYFVGAAAGSDPMPLILDGANRTSGVAGAMRRIADDSNTEADRAMRLWWSTNDRTCAEGYALYVKLVNEWADKIGCRPDAIEMAMFSGL